jgi:hypothetical protein
MKVRKEIFSSDVVTHFVITNLKTDAYRTSETLFRESVSAWQVTRRESECLNLLNELSSFFFFLPKTFKCRIARVFACFEESQAQMCRTVTCGVQAVTGNWTCLRQVATCLGEVVGASDNRRFSKSR